MISRRNLMLGGAAVPFLSYMTLVPAFAATPTDILVVAQQLDNMTSLDPHESFEAVGSEICGNIYQKLVHPSLDDADKVEPSLAASWESDAEGKVFTFKMRSDAKFASGAPVTAEDAAFSLQRVIKMNKSPAFIIAQFGFTADKVEQQIVAVDASTLRLTLDKPASLSFLLYCLSANVGSIVEKKIALANVANNDFGNAYLQKNTAGSGEWMLQSWKASESVSLQVNPNGAYKGNIKRILLRHVVDPSSQLLMLQKGDIDIARNLTTEQLRTLQGDANYELIRKGVASLVLLSLNQNNANLAKPQVWQAVKWALDYKGMQENLVPLTHKIHQSFLPEGFPGAVNDTPFQRDVAKAKALMAEAGLADGFEIAMDHYSAQPYPDLAQAIQANLADIGIKVSLQSAENRQVLTKMRAREHQMALSAWGSDYFDPHANADVFNINKDNSADAKAKPFLWRSSFQDAELTAKAEAARDEKNPEKRIELYVELQKASMEHSPFAFMFQVTTTAACRKNVSGVRLGTLSDSHSYAKAAKV